jgi:hypothetical protein
MVIMNINFIEFETGSVFYHGTSYPGFEVLADPSWVTDNEYAGEDLATIHDASDTLRLFTLETKRPIKLILAHGKKDFVLALEELNIDYDYDSVFGDDKYVILDPFELADIVCEDGRFDGWHTPDQYRNGGSDTLICRPSEVLELINIEEGEA